MSITGIFNLEHASLALNATDTTIGYMKTFYPINLVYARFISEAGYGIRAVVLIQLKRNISIYKETFPYTLGILDTPIATPVARDGGDDFTVQRSCFGRNVIKVLPTTTQSQIHQS